MTAEQLRNSILQEAISGRLVPQDPNDEPAAVISTVSEDEIPFEVPSSWRWVFLQDCAAIIGGYAFPSASIKGEKGVRVIRISDINEKGFVNKSVVRYNGHENLNKFKIIPQDILIAMTGGTVGKSLFVQQMEEDMLLNQRVAIIRNNGQYAPYIDIVVKSPHIKSFINDKKNSTNDNISMGDINSFLVPLPPLAEQKRIVAKLEELLPFVEQYGKAQKELDELNAALPTRLRQSILQEAISGRLIPQDPNDEPASVLLQRIREEKAQLVKEGKLKKKDLVETPITEEEIPFEIPSSWEWVRLSTYVDVRDGTHDSPKYHPSGIPFVTSKNLKNGRIDFSTCTFISQSDHDKFSERSCVEDGDILFAMIGSIGNPVIVAKDREFSVKNVALFKRYSREYTNNKYLYYYLSYIQNELKQIAAGGVQSFVGLGTLRQYLIPLPPLAEQARVVAKIEELFEQIDKISQ